MRQAEGRPGAQGSLGWIARAAAVVLLVALAVVGGRILYDWFNERYTVETEDGQAVARVVQATMLKAGDLRVSTLRGTVQGTASAERLGGLLRATMVIKAPFTVDYFVDLPALGPRDFRWNEESRTLTVDLPAITRGQPNIDEGRLLLRRTDGVFVTRGQMGEMSSNASLRAERIAQAEAGKPERMAEARRLARSAVESMFADVLRAGGVRATVRVRFPDDAVTSRERWDMSRSLDEIYADGREGR